MKSSNPYAGLIKGLDREHSPQSLNEYIIAQKRRISEFIASIQQAEQYLEAHPGHKPTLFRLNSMARDKAKACSRLRKLEHNLELLVKRLGGVRPHSKPARGVKS